MIVGSVSLALTSQVADPGESHGLSLANPVHVAVYLGLLAIAHVILKVTGYVMFLAPVAVFGAMTAIIAKQGLSILTTYSIFIGEFYFGLFLDVRAIRESFLLVRIRGHRWLRTPP